MAEKPAFRQRQCLIPATGFYEWQAGQGGKQPHHIAMKDGQPFALASLWERWHRGGHPIESCTIIVTAANDLLRPIHDRMPVIVAPADFQAWLDATTPVDAVKALLRPFPAEPMKVWPVSTMVNKPANDEPECIAPIAELLRALSVRAQRH